MEQNTPPPGAPPGASGPTWQSSYPVEGPPGGGPIYLGFQCTDMPTDSTVACTAPGPDPQNSVNIPRTPIMNPHMTYMVQVVWPPNFNSTITISWWEGRTPPPPGAGIQPVAAYPTEDGGNHILRTVGSAET